MSTPAVRPLLPCDDMLRSRGTNERAGAQRSCLGCALSLTVGRLLFGLPSPRRRKQQAQPSASAPFSFSFSCGIHVREALWKSSASGQIQSVCDVIEHCEGEGISHAAEGAWLEFHRFLVPSPFLTSAFASRTLSGWMLDGRQCRHTRKKSVQHCCIVLPRTAC